MNSPESTPRYWFRAKRYGWGWTPCTWEGWAVVAVACVIFGGAILATGMEASSNAALLFITLPAAVLALAVLAAVAWRRGEPPRWRWGK